MQTQVGRVQGEVLPYAESGRACAESGRAVCRDR